MEGRWSCGPRIQPPSLRSTRQRPASWSGGIERALARMPATAREVLLLVGVAGLEPSEAAVVCGVTPEALRQRLSRARAQLARALEERERPGSVVVGEVAS